MLMYAHVDAFRQFRVVLCKKSVMSCSAYLGTVL